MRFGRYVPYINSADPVLLVPLLNLLFLVAVFSFLFMGYIPSASGIRVDLPKALTSQSVKYPLVEIIVKDDGAVFLNGSAVSGADLEIFLKQLLGKKAGVLINADKKAPLQSVIAVWDAVRASGVSDCLTATHH